ncbi:hypothetical protein ASG54_23240 [Aureimonas sp. Leaf460]|nr:hypothetical protein ASG62_23970 [Aureimonas sp. Leaf427]KQT62225.1 hypothetical protein ASG54_23240 [Aureimonas sp. Leaf460]
MAERLTQRVGATYDGLCFYELTKSRVVVANALLQRLIARAGPEAERREASRRALRSIVDALACHPMDGELWYALAVRERDEEMKSSRLRALMQMSIDLDPMSAHLLMQRSALMASLIGSPQLGQDLGPVVDFRRALALLHDEDVLPLLRLLELYGRPEVAQVFLTQLPIERRDRLTRGLLREHEREEDANRGYEFTPFGQGDTADKKR